MRRLILIVVCAIGLLAAAPNSKAQVNVNVNISSQPLWGPVGYDYVEYYYLPDLEMYYYVPAHKFVYINGGRWVFASTLPYRYRNYDLYNTYKVVINEPRPYRYYHYHRMAYAHYAGGPHNQVFIRSSRDPRYFGVAGHPYYHHAHVVTHYHPYGHAAFYHHRPAVAHSYYRSWGGPAHRGNHAPIHQEHFAQRSAPHPGPRGGGEGHMAHAGGFHGHR